VIALLNREIDFRIMKARVERTLGLKVLACLMSMIWDDKGRPKS